MAGVSERLRSRLFQATTLLLVIVGIGAGVGVGRARAAGPTQRLAVVGAIPPGLAEAAAQMSAESAGARIEVGAVADAAAGRAHVLAGRLDAVALDSTHVVVLHDTDGAKAALLIRALRRAEIAQRLVGAGVEPTEARRLVGSPTADIDVAALRPLPTAAAVAAFGVIAAVCFVFGYGMWIAQGVVHEKTSGVSNIMLAMCPPARFIVGKTLGVGAAALIQAAVAALPSVVVPASRSHDVSAPPAVLAGAVMWFVLAFALYGHLIAAIAAWARRIDRMSGILVWITLPMVVMAFGGVLWPFTSRPAPWLPSPPSFPSQRPSPCRCARPPPTWGGGRSPGRDRDRRRRRGRGSPRGPGLRAGTGPRMNAAEPAHPAASAGEPAARPPAAAVVGLTVSQLHDALDEALRSAGLAQLWVTGVVQSLRQRPRYSSFELVEYHPDAQRVKAVLPVSVFGAEAAAIAATLAGVGVELAEGLEAAFYGRLAANGAYGPLRMVATRVDPRIALGAAVVARDTLLAELANTGELTAQRRLQVPALPRRIGLVAGSEGAGRADVLAVLGSSPIAFEVLEETAAMSGAGAAGDVARALARLCGRGAEVVVLARGGGARSNLACWDTPELVRAITRCRVPVFTALGHASDRSVADEVAAQAFSTPSAAAAALVARARGGGQGP